MNNAKTTTTTDEQRGHEVTETKVELGPFKVLRRRWVDLTKLSQLASVTADAFRPLRVLNTSSPDQAGFDISASAEQREFDWREVTGEDIVELTARAHGQVVEIERDDSGLITSISASIGTVYEYDADEMSEVLESLHATGVTPKKLLGDLAQTSVLVGGTQIQVVGLAEWTLDWKRKTADATTTDDAEYESSLGSTKSWSVKAKYMFIDGDTSQESYVIAAIDTLQNDAQTWNFFTTVELGRAAFQGAAIVDGLTIATGMGKTVGLDCSLKGTGRLLRLQQTAPVTNPDTVTGQTAQVPVS